MELRNLRTIIAAAERGSFTRAAERMELTQAAVSQQIGAVETELDTRLFDRQGRGVQLTESGHRLCEYARQILDLVDEATREVGGGQQPLTGNLRIATSSVPAEWLVPELLSEFRVLWPHIHETMAVSDSSQAEDAVESGAADIGFVGALPRSSALRASPVVEDELVLVVAVDHPMAAKGITTLKQLRNESLIVREAGSASRRCVELALEDQGHFAAEFTIALESNSNDAIRAAVKRGVGVAFFSRAAIRDDRGLASVKVRGFHPRRQLYVISDPDRITETPARKFLAFVEEWRSRHVTMLTGTT
jgi:DNA-binding transcriptional LysR family regulator